MKSILPSFRPLLFVVALAAQARSLPAATTTVFSEDFSSITTGDSTTTGGSSSGITSLSGFQTLSKAYKAGGAVKLGTGSATGSITTTNLTLSAGTVDVSVDVKGWTSVEGKLEISFGNQKETITYTAVMSGSFETVHATFDTAGETAAVTFATTDKRCFLDNIVVTLTTEGGAPSLSIAPAESVIDFGESVSIALNATTDNGTPPVLSVSPDVGAIADGVFTWTPSAPGVYPLTFTATDSLDTTLSATASATVTVIFPTPQNLEADPSTTKADLAWDPVVGADHYDLTLQRLDVAMTCFVDEPFGYFKSASSSAISASALGTALSGWSVENVYTTTPDSSNNVDANEEPIGYSLKLGSSSKKGSIATPGLDLSKNNGRFTVTFDARSWKNDNTTIKIIAGGETKTQTLSNSLTTYSYDFTNGADGMTVKIEASKASNARFFLKNLKIESVARDLVTVLGPLSVSGTSYSATGLTPGAEYKMIVDAVYDETTHASADRMFSTKPLTTMFFVQ